MTDTTKRDAVLQEFYAQAAVMGLPYEYCHTLVVDSMTDEIVRLRAILAKLREPSEAIVDAVNDLGDLSRLTYTVISVAVAVAEQEVGRE